jgi:hypothetical protein
MKESELNNLVNKTLQDFESMESISFSEDWGKNLMYKVNTSRLNPKLKTAKAIIGVFVIIITVNIGFVLNAINTSSLVEKQKEWRVISSELLINEVK